MAKGNRKIYYGWIVVAAGFIICSVGFGIQYSFGVFFKPLQDTFGWSRATTSWAMTTHLLFYALFMVPGGWAIDRFKARTVFSIAALLIGFALVACSRISQPWQFYLLYGVPLGIGISIYAPAILTIVSRWFAQKRGVALGITTAGVGFGTLTMAPLSNFLVVSYGWRNSFMILGIASCIILLVCTYFIRSSPQELDRKAIKPQNNSETPAPLPSRGMSLRQAIRTKEMALIILANIFVTFAVKMLIVHIIPRATDIGISASAAALAVGTIGGFSVLGRLVMGVAQDRIGPQRAMVICLIIQGVSMLALPFIRSDLPFFAYAVVFGFTYGGDIPQVPAIAALCFGLASMGATYGLVLTAGNLAAALGPIVAGYIFDLTGSYTLVFLGAAAGLFAGVFCIRKIRLPGQ